MVDSSSRNGTKNVTLVLKVDQVAALLGLSERSVWRLASTGELPQPIRLGRSRRWVLATIEQFVQDKEQEAVV